MERSVANHRRGAQAKVGEWHAAVAAFASAMASGLKGVKMVAGEQLALIATR